MKKELFGRGIYLLAKRLTTKSFTSRPKVNASKRNAVVFSLPRILNPEQFQTLQLFKSIKIWYRLLVFYETHDTNENEKLSQCMTKPAKWSVRQAKTQTILGIRRVWSVSSLCALWVAKDPNFLQTDSEDSNQTGRMPRLIWVFAGRTSHFVDFLMFRLKYSWIIEYLLSLTLQFNLKFRLSSQRHPDHHQTSHHVTKSLKISWFVFS